MIGLPVPVHGDPNIPGLILAGGRSSRMGGDDKCFRHLCGRPLLEHVIDRATPQVCRIIISSNSDAENFTAYELPVIGDVISDFAGPLAGVLSGLDWVSENIPQARWMASFATDTPFFPMDMVTRLAKAIDGTGASMASAASGGRMHPVFSLWPVTMRNDLRRAMNSEKIRRAGLWVDRCNTRRVEFGKQPFDPFFNINTPDDLAAAEQAAMLVR